MRRVGKDLFDDDTADTVAEEYDRSCFLLFKVRFLFYPINKDDENLASSEALASTRAFNNS